MVNKNPNYSNEYFGMSTDTKPTDALNASRFYEIDTSDVYMFDEEGKQWFKQRGSVSGGNTSGGSSGSGSSSGSSGVLIVNASVAQVPSSGQMVRLDKTWQEIHDAAYAVVSANASANGEVYVNKDPITTIRVVNGVYAVGTYGSGAIMFTTDSPDGYPSVTAETSSSGTLPEGSSITPAPVPVPEEQAESGQG